MNRSIRLTLEVQDGKVTLKGAQRVEMRAPPASATRKGKEGASGVWVELRSDGAVVYQRRLTQQFEPSVEIPTGDPRQAFVRADRRGAFRVEVVVPALPSARVALCERRAEPAAKSAEAQGSPRHKLIEHFEIALDSDLIKGGA